MRSLLISLFLNEQFNSLSWIHSVAPSAKEAPKVCGTIMIILWILAFIGYSIFVIVSFDVSTPIISIQDRFVATMPGNLTLNSLNFSLTLVGRNSTTDSGGNLIFSTLFDCTSTPDYYTLSYFGSSKALISSDQSFEDNIEYLGSFIAYNHSYPFFVDLAQADPSEPFATILISSQLSNSGTSMIYIQTDLTNL